MNYRIFAALVRFLFVVLLGSVCSQAQQPKEPLVNDPELLAAMELFVGMSGKEREETIQGLMAAVGDDPAKRAEMETLLKMLPKMDDTSNIKQMIHDDEIAKAKQEVARQLDGSDWDSFWSNQAEILEATLASGQLSPEDAALFKTDEDAWKKQLKIIWDDLQRRNHEEL